MTYHIVYSIIITYAHSTCCLTIETMKLLFKNNTVYPYLKLLIQLYLLSKIASATYRNHKSCIAIIYRNC